MTSLARPRTPANLSLRLPADVSAALHRRAYETGTSKRDLVIDALRAAHIGGDLNEEEAPRT